MKLLTTENSKTSKGTKLGYLTGILYLAPHNIAGYGTICPQSTAGCRAACLYTAGRGAFKSIQQSRIIKTIHLMENREGFLDQLNEDIWTLRRKAKRLGLRPAVRLNGTSDLNWQHITPELFLIHSDVQFYDYTKDLDRRSKFANYDLSYSVAENTFNRPECSTSDGMIQFIERLPSRLVVVFENKPANYLGLPVVNGDDHDLRFLDTTNCVIGLTPKGKAKKDKTNFVERHAK